MNRKLLNEELNRKSVEAFKQADKTPLVIILDNVRSLNNVGSVFRTADSFLLEAVYLCGITGIPPHRDIHKTALGATETVSWKHFTSAVDAIKELRTKAYKVYAIEQANKAIYLDAFNPKGDKGLALVFGNEINGVGQDTVNACDGCIEIPQLGSKHSLNISVSVGIVVWDTLIKMNIPLNNAKSTSH